VPLGSSQMGAAQGVVTYDTAAPASVIEAGDPLGDLGQVVDGIEELVRQGSARRGRSSAASRRRPTADKGRAIVLM
jgi:hypothetical protein